MASDNNQTTVRSGFLGVAARNWRRTIAIGCVLLAGTVIFLHLMNVSTSDAVLDGRRIVIRAQIAGEVVGSLPNVGAIVDKGDVVAMVRAPVKDERNMLTAHARMREVYARMAALDAQHSDLRKLQGQLDAEFLLFIKATASTTAAQIEAAKADLISAESDYSVAKAEAARAKVMTNTGSMGQSDIDRRLGNEISTNQRISIARAELSRLMAEAGAIAMGSNSRDGQNNVPYSRQRMDEISISLAESTKQRADLAAVYAGLSDQIVLETAWLATQSESTDVANGQSVVWLRPVAVGTDVSKGDILVELVDCADMFVVARIPANKASVIALGEIVSVEVAGISRSIPGEVRIIRSLSSGESTGSSAAGLVPRGEEHLAEVEIAVEQQASPTDGRNFCGIGSGARVRFPVRSIFASLFPKF